MPFVILGCVAVLAGLLTMLLPETMGRKLPDTIEEAERMTEEGFGENDEMSEDHNQTTETQRNGLSQNYLKSTKMWLFQTDLFMDPKLIDLIQLCFLIRNFNNVILKP